MAITPVNVGQAPNDGNGDPLRTAFQKVNGNSTDLDARVTQTQANAQAALVLAQGALPASQLGVGGGAAKLTPGGKLESSQVPDLSSSYIPANAKGAAGGVAPLDSGNKVPAQYIPETGGGIPASEKGQAGGVATLDEEGKVPQDQLPASSGGIPADEKGQPNGVATLDDEGQVPESQIPDLDYVPSSSLGQSGGPPVLDDDAKVPLNNLPVVDKAAPAAGQLVQLGDDGMIPPDLYEQGGGGSSIDDGTVSDSTTWSSEKQVATFRQLGSRPTQAITAAGPTVLERGGSYAVFSTVSVQPQIQLPAGAVPGDELEILDPLGSWENYPVVLLRNGQPLMNQNTEDYRLNKARWAWRLRFIDPTVGWIFVS